MAATLYWVILAIGREPLPGANERFQRPARVELQRPQRLEPVLDDLDAKDLQAIVQQDSRLLPLRVLLDLGENGPTGAGVASFHTETGGDFRWLPLSAASADPSGKRAFEVSARQNTTLTITYAATREQARHGYIDRSVVTVREAADAQKQTVELSAKTYAIRFELPSGVDQAGPLRLQRVADRQWLPMAHATAGLKLRKGEQTALELGAGTYELQAPLVTDTRQTFVVPEVEVVEVTPALARSAADRR